MIEQTRGADVFDYFWEWQRRQTVPRRNPIAELALDKCEEMFLRRNWESFAYWHAVYHRERAKALPHSIR